MVLLKEFMSCHHRLKNAYNQISFNNNLTQAKRRVRLLLYSVFDKPSAYRRYAILLSPYMR